MYVPEKHRFLQEHHGVTSQESYSLLNLEHHFVNVLSFCINLTDIVDVKSLCSVTENALIFS
jgi:hypothetical protein